MTDIPIIDFENFGCGDDALRGSKIVMEAFAMALDLPVDFFRNCQHGENIALRYLHYPVPLDAASGQACRESARPLLDRLFCRSGYGYGCQCVSKLCRR